MWSRCHLPASPHPLPATLQGASLQLGLLHTVVRVEPLLQALRHPADQEVSVPAVLRRGACQGYNLLLSVRGQVSPPQAAEAESEGVLQAEDHAETGGGAAGHQRRSRSVGAPWSTPRAVLRRNPGPPPVGADGSALPASPALHPTRGVRPHPAREQREGFQDHAQHGHPAPPVRPGDGRQRPGHDPTAHASKAVRGDPRVPAAGPPPPAGHQVYRGRLGEDENHSPVRVGRTQRGGGARGARLTVPRHLRRLPHHQ
ncbi:hypothetical protein FJT64_006139 [Amphibalanus amphitrite]|uniref:Uncharacterized protein n=1 Tax=Amphibalanus amphitrite TaxID=1232801 RepID=A0A6A4VYG4_AMPAM|nr:hypothetical protein FJT64_006139 [Amphibalanus amphitrite]